MLAVSESTLRPVSRLHARGAGPAEPGSKRSTPLAAAVAMDGWPASLAGQARVNPEAPRLEAPMPASAPTVATPQPSPIACHRAMATAGDLRGQSALASRRAAGTQPIA